MKIIPIILVMAFCVSCSSVPYTSVNGIKANPTSMTIENYLLSSSDSILQSYQTLNFNSRGKIVSSIKRDTNDSLMSKTERRTWFVKKEYPNVLPQYCKTRFKPNHRERKSCYTQKKHKENEEIVHYNNLDQIIKVEDNFTNYTTSYYVYDTNGFHTQTVIKDRFGNFIQDISYTCIKKDAEGNCELIEERNSLDAVIKIKKQQFSY
ncbi:MAG: hypothetical protein BM564_02690 [Bacteroidetes bacterium MedPE-SWsnd-G2]|nr:MAG: hypothetical protein BM564_02690 [Bacteroidetes bacterium MedPE-SWsnd-G2]